MVVCKMCMVEMDGKCIYSCNMKVKNNVIIFINIFMFMDERKSIM